MNNREQIIGNLSSILKIVTLIVAPAIAVYLNTSEDTAIALLTAVFGLILGIIDAKFPNTFIKGENND